MKKIPICVAYDVNGVLTTEFPMGDDLNVAKPVIEYVDGWNCDISHCRTKEDLPAEVIAYVKKIEELVDCKIKYVSVGAEREAYVTMY